MQQNQQILLAKNHLMWEKQYCTEMGSMPNRHGSKSCALSGNILRTGAPDQTGTISHPPHPTEDVILPRCSAEDIPLPLCPLKDHCLAMAITLSPYSA